MDNEKNIEILGEVIKKRRNELGIGQRELARMISMTHPTISRLENVPDAKADTDTLILIANALKLSPNYLISLNNKTVKIDEDISLIARATEHMSAEDREKMMSTLKDMFVEAFKKADSKTGNK